MTATTMTAGRQRALHALAALSPTPTVRGEQTMTATVSKLCQNGDGRKMHAHGRCKSCYDKALISGEIAVVPGPAIPDFWAPAWTARAACNPVTAEDHFPDKGGSAAAAKSACARCPVRAECLEAAMAMRPLPAGVWGGTTEDERRNMRRRQRRQEVAAA